MGLRDIPFWGRMAGVLLDTGMDHLGAKKCATKGHTWRDVGAIVVHEDKSVEELPRGAMQRCRRCGAERAAPQK